LFPFDLFMARTIGRDFLPSLKSLPTGFFVIFGASGERRSERDGDNSDSDEEQEDEGNNTERKRKMERRKEKIPT